MEEEFLGYLDEWDTEAKGRPGFIDDEKNKMTLSQETHEGHEFSIVFILFFFFILVYSFC